MTDRILLADLRRQVGMTQDQLAHAIGLSQSRVCDIEHADPNRTHVSTLARYIAGLGGSLRVRVEFADESVHWLDIPAPRVQDDVE